MQLLLGEQEQKKVIVANATAVAQPSLQTVGVCERGANMERWLRASYRPSPYQQLMAIW